MYILFSWSVFVLSNLRVQNELQNISAAMHPKDSYKKSKS